MIVFLLRKSFFHCWDHLYALLGVNLCLALLLALYVYLASLPGGTYLGIGVIYLINLLIGTTSVGAQRISDYAPPEGGLVPGATTAVWRDALFFTACVVLQGVALNHVIPFYLTLGSKLLGLSLGVLLFLACATWWMAMIYYYPVRLRLDLPVFRAARRAFLLFIDNLPLSFAIFLLTGASLVLSLVTTMLLPGIGFLLVFHQVAGRTLLLKSRYLETHPQERGGISWSLVLKDDLEMTGARSVKGILFPWKE